MISTPRRPVLPDSEHTSRPWRIHALVPDFTLEDVWALPVCGDAHDFSLLVELMTSGASGEGSGHGTGAGDDGIDFLDSAAARSLWRLRDLLGRLLRIGRIIDAPGDARRRPIPGDESTSLAARLDDDLVGTADGVRFTAVPLSALYLCDDEFAAELSNATMHGVMHLSWVPRSGGGYEGRMAVLVKPRGPLGRIYMAAIKPFRLRVVYPALLRHLANSWRRASSAT